MKGFLFDQQGTSTFIVAQLSDHGREDRRHCLDQIHLEATATKGLEPSDLRIGGSSYTCVQIKDATNQSLMFGLPAVFLASFVALFCLRSLRLTFASLLTAGMAALTSVALVALLGFKVQRLARFDTRIGPCINSLRRRALCSYYTKALAQQNADPVGRMVAVGWRPCTLALLTTSVGIFMLCTSHIEAVRHFGFFSTVSLLVALAILLIIFPSILRVWQPNGREIERFCKPISKTAVPIRHSTGSRYFWPSMVTLIALLIVCPVLCVGLGQIKTTLSHEALFEAESDVTRKHAWFTDRFQTLKCVEVVARFRKTAERNEMVDQLQKVAQVQSSLAQLDQSQSTFSLVNFCRLPSSRRPMRRSAERSLIDQRLNRDKAALIEQKLIAEDEENRYWRIRLGVQLADDVAFESLMAVLSNRSSIFAEESGDDQGWLLPGSGRWQHRVDTSCSLTLRQVLCSHLRLSLR